MPKSPDQASPTALSAPELQELDLHFAFHPFTSIREHEASGPLVIVEGHGCRLTDSLGRSYLDAMAGLWCVNIGYGNEEMADARPGTGRAGCRTTTRSRRWPTTYRPGWPRQLVYIGAGADGEGVLRH